MKSGRLGLQFAKGRNLDIDETMRALTLQKDQGHLWIFEHDGGRLSEVFSSSFLAVS